MDQIILKKLIIWLLLSLNLLSAFIIGLSIPLLALFLLPLMIIFIYFPLQYLMKSLNKSLIRKEIVIWIILTVNLLFAFIIGFSIPIMVEESKYNMVLIMIPLLVILNYIILDRFHYYLRHANDREESSNVE